MITIKPNFFHNIYILMFSLNQKNKDKAKNSKPFPQKPSNNNNNNKSKKVNKTVFEDPYHYRM